MKKFLLMLAMMLPCLGAWAQEFVTPEVGKYYKIKGAHGTNPWLTATIENGGIDVATEEANAGIYLRTEKGLKVLNGPLVVEKDKYLGTGGSQISLVDTEAEVTIEEADNGRYYIKTGGRYLYNNQADYTREAGNLTAAGTDDPKWGFIEVPVDKDVCSLKNWSNNFKFKVAGSRGFIYVDGDGNLKGTNNANTEFSEENANHHFAIIKCQDKFYLYNIGAQKFVVRNGNNGQGQGVALSEKPEHAITISSASDLTTDFDWVMNLNGANVHLSNGGGHTYGIRCADGQDEGTRWAFEMVSTFDATPILEEHFKFNYTITDIAGNTYTAENVEGVVGVDPVFTGVEGYTLSNQSWSGKTFSATINYNLPFDLSTESTTNLITIGQGTWGDAEGGADAKLWTVVGGNVKVVNGIPTLGTAQWMVYPTIKDTKIGFKIKSASTGKFVTANLTIGNDANANKTPVTLTAEGTEFSFIGTTCGNDEGFAYTNNNGVTMYLTRNGKDDNDALLGVYQVSNSHHGSGLRFPEFRQYKVVIGDAGYTTVYSPFTALTNDPQYNPENYTNGNFVEIYTIAEQEVVKDKVQLTQMSYYIPGGSAAILKGNKGTYVFTRSNDDEEDYNADTQALWAQNKLEGSSVNTYVAGNAYVLGVIDEEVGLYKAELNKNANGENGESHFLNNAGKAYLPASFTTSTLGVLRFNFGGTTAIESVLNNNTDANAPIYDLSGRRIMNTVKGGIYIQNGKKFIVK